MSEPTLKDCSAIHSLKIDKTWLNTKNKYWYCLWKGKPKAIHRVLAETYLPNPDSLGDVHHKDGSRNNNQLDNLEWCTRSQNIWHSYNSHGRRPSTLGKFNEDHHCSIPICSTCMLTGARYEFPSLHEAGRMGFQISKISLCINGKRNHHGGYIWSKV